MTTSLVSRTFLRRGFVWKRLPPHSNVLLDPVVGACCFWWRFRVETGAKKVSLSSFQRRGLETENPAFFPQFLDARQSKDLSPDLASRVPKDYNSMRPDKC